MKLLKLKVELLNVVSDLCETFVISGLGLSCWFDRNVQLIFIIWDAALLELAFKLRLSFIYVAAQNRFHVCVTRRLRLIDLKV